MPTPTTLGGLTDSPAIRALMQLWDKSMNDGSPDPMLAEIGRMVSGADTQAVAAKGALNTAMAAPLPQTNMIADTIARSLGSMAAGLTGTDAGPMAAETSIKEEQGRLNQKRAEHLAMLEDSYSRAAARSAKIGDLESQMKLLEMHDKTALKREAILKTLEGQIISDRAAATSASERGNSLIAAGFHPTKVDANGMPLPLPPAGGKAATPKPEGNMSYLSSEVGTTASGRRFLNLTNIPLSDRRSALNWASDQKIPAVSAPAVDRLSRIQSALSNIDTMLAQAESILPGTPQERIAKYGNRKMSTVLQTNDMRVAWKTWRIAAIQQLTALAGGMGSGLRINQAEIQQAVRNDIPTLNDTYASALRKANNIRTMLHNTEDPIVEQDWRANFVSADKDTTGAKGVIDLDALDRATGH